MLFDARGIKENLWTSFSETGNVQLYALLSLEQAENNSSHLDEVKHENQVGLSVDGHEKLSRILPFLPEIALLIIDFPSFSDGRGFSLARMVRRGGFKGVLRARGALITDQFAYALAVGFDELEIPDDLATRQPLELWLQALHHISHTYQRSYGTSNILDQRKAAREAVQ